ncbi:cation:proton antiporter domain-containing protein [Microvirga yunnanensis]|uniref:cation:proton antiporter domain-containing protein n=1 Tax=Microvirga yunnanensis TaxID=2953740 RepID=UPI0021C918AD|nr:cation:proton antiporter [Microvirga sp. HBU65207]
MEFFEVLLGLLAACVALALVARRLKVPLAAVLVLGGMMLALIPSLPAVDLDPQLALVVFLPPWSHAVTLPWAGMRGVVSLAAALALPSEFPNRDIILFLAFCAILATLVLQGTALGPLIRLMGLDRTEGEPLNPTVTPDAIDARSEATVAAMTAVKDEADYTHGEEAAVASDLLRRLKQGADQADRMQADMETGSQRLETQLRLRLIAVEAARAKLLADRTHDLYTDAMSTFVAELDLEEQRIRTALGEA